MCFKKILEKYHILENNKLAPKCILKNKQIKMVVVFDKSRQLIDKQLENLTKFFGKYHIELMTVGKRSHKISSNYFIFMGAQV